MIYEAGTQVAYKGRIGVVIKDFQGFIKIQVDGEIKDVYSNEIMVVTIKAEDILDSEVLAQAMNMLAGTEALMIYNGDSYREVSEVYTDEDGDVVIVEKPIKQKWRDLRG